MNQINRVAAFESEGPRVDPPLARELERLLKQYEADVRSFIFALLPNWSDAEDVLQRTRIILWQKFPAFEPGTNFRAWAMQIARHEVNNFRRSRQRERLCFDDKLVESLAEAHLSLIHDLEQRRAALDYCIQKLRASDRQIVHHCYGPSATTAKEAAVRLKRPVNTLYKALNRIRRALADCVQQQVQEEPEDLK
jgi:RNA polymerase sigma-70 factor (ECF subfamily)